MAHGLIIIICSVAAPSLLTLQKQQIVLVMNERIIKHRTE